LKWRTQSAGKDHLGLVGAEPIAGDITFKTLDEIDFSTSPGEGVASARVCAGIDTHLNLILPRVAEPSQDFDGTPDYTKNCRTTDFTF
jgi:hypothetical protein